jgi:crotonobetainyl-CoA:carnitine CoA-transferase CaiB-like acyl-CoA transferase
VPSAPINRYEQALADKQAVHLQLVQDMTLPSGRATRTVACPVWLDGAPVPVNPRPPLLGESPPPAKV